MDDEEIEAVRNRRLDFVKEHGWPETVVMQMHHQTLSQGGCADDPWDEDGDAILVEWSVGSGDGPLVKVEFPRGTAPAVAARVLRKSADMLEGPDGEEITKCRPREDDIDGIKRLADGRLHLDYANRDYYKWLADHPDLIAASPRRFREHVRVKMAQYEKLASKVT